MSLLRKLGAAVTIGGCRCDTHDPRLMRLRSVRPAARATVTIQPNSQDRERSEFHVWRLLFEQAPEAVAVLTPMTASFASTRNSRACSVMNLTKLLQRPINDLIVPEAEIESSRAYTHLLKQGGRVEVETVRRRKDGTEIDVSLLAISVRTTSGEQVVNYAIYRDITERKRAEERCGRARPGSRQWPIRRRC